MKSDRPPLARPASARLQEQHLGHARGTASSMSSVLEHRSRRPDGDGRDVAQGSRKRRQAHPGPTATRGARPDDRRADGPRRRARAGHRRAERRAGRRHGELHGPEAAPGRRGRDGRRSAPRPGREVFPPALFRDDAQRPPARPARPTGRRLSGRSASSSWSGRRASRTTWNRTASAVSSRSSWGCRIFTSRPTTRLPIPRALPCASRPCWRRCGPRPDRSRGQAVKPTAGEPPMACPAGGESGSAAAGGVDERRRLQQSVRSRRMDCGPRIAAAPAAVRGPPETLARGVCPYARSARPDAAVCGPMDPRLGLGA